MLRPRLRTLWPVLAVTLLAACGDDPETMRQVTLTPALELPEGSSTVDTGSLTVAVDRLEALVEGAQYAVWLEAGASGDVSFLGALDAEGGLEVAITETPAAGSSIIITEETASALLDLPSGPARLEGSIGGALVFDPALAAALSASHGTAVLRNADAEIELEGLPDAPEGMYFVAWADLGDGHAHDESDDHHDEPVVDDHHDEPATDDHHDDPAVDDHHDEPAVDDHHDEPAVDDHHDDPAVDDHHDDPVVDEHDDGGGMTELGALDHGHLHMTHHSSLAGSHGIIITLESEHGHAEMSPIRVLSGEVVLPEIEQDGHAHSH